MAPSILLLDSNAARQAELCEALAPIATCSFASREELLAALESPVSPLVQGAGLVVAPATEARRLVRDLDRLRPDLRRAFFCDPENPEDFASLAKLSTEGQLLYMLEGNADDQARAVQAIVEPRESQRLPSALETRVSFDLDDQILDGALEDISTVGLGTTLELRDLEQLAQLAPGTRVSRLRLHHGHVLLLEAAEAVIRRQELLPGAGRRVLLGVELSPPRANESGSGKVTEPPRIEALLRRALRSGSDLRLRRPTEPQRLLEIGNARLETLIGRRQLKGSVKQGRLEPGEVLELHFEFAGRGYWGNVSHLDSRVGASSFSLPPLLRLAHRRRALRRRAAESSVGIALASPLTGQHIIRPTLDHTGSGVSFVIDGSREALPPGLILGNVSLTLPSGQRHECRGQVRYAEPLPLNSSPGVDRPYRIGLGLIDVSEGLRSELLESHAQSERPILSADDASYQAVWGLFHEAGREFDLYPRVAGGPSLEILQAAQRSLCRARGALGKSFISGGERLDGYAMGLRLYSRTWQTQHLTVMPRFDRDDNISQRLSSAVVEYGESLPDVDFMRYIWFDNVRWTARLSLFIARQLASPGLTHLARLASMLLPANSGNSSALSGGGVQEATFADRTEIEGLLLQRGEQVRLLADDWRADEMDLRSLRARSEPHGIQRQRKVFVVRERGELRAFAFAESATPGLELHEFTNSFRLFPGIIREGQSDLLARAALAARCIGHYRRLGQPYVVGLVSTDDVPLLESLGFQHRGNITEWTFHKRLVRAWQELATAQFERVQRASKSIANADSEQAA